MTYWDERSVSSRRKSRIRIILLASVALAVATHHLFPVVAGLLVAGIIYVIS
jgi:hypothetical protein